MAGKVKKRLVVARKTRTRWQGLYNAAVRFSPPNGLKRRMKKSPTSRVTTKRNDHLNFGEAQNQNLCEGGTL